MFIQKRKVMADSEVDVAPEATDLLFEAEDVAELVAEVTGQVVEVTAEGDEVTFAVGEGEEATEFTVTADGDEEVLESSRRNFRGKKNVAASRKVAASTSKTPAKQAKTVRKIPSAKR